MAPSTPAMMPTGADELLPFEGLLIAFSATTDEDALGASEDGFAATEDELRALEDELAAEGCDTGTGVTMKKSIEYGDSFCTSVTLMTSVCAPGGRLDFAKSGWLGTLSVASDSVVTTGSLLSTRYTAVGGL